MLDSTTSDHRPASRREGWYFLRRCLRDPIRVGSFWPSSPHLAAAMLDGIRLEPGDFVVEYGPGTGAFTRRIAAVLRAAPGTGYLGIERDRGFYELLVRRFPDLTFVHRGVEDLSRILAEHGRARAKAVICGLPLVILPPKVVHRLLIETRRLIGADGVLRTFTYVHSMANPGSWRLRRRMGDIFGEAEQHLVRRNVPPALVLSWRHSGERRPGS